MKKIFICSAIFVLFVLVVSTSVSGNFAKAGPLENATVNITIELTPDARREITVHAEMPTTSFNVNLALLSSANVQVNISSPSPRSLRVTSSGSVTLTQPVDPDIDVQITQLALAYSTAPGILNSYLQQIVGSYIENLGDRSPELADLQLENISITNFNWQSPTLSAGLNMTFGSAIFENQQLRDKLPINLSGSINVSSTMIRLRLDGNSENVNGWIDVVVTPDTMRMDAFISLPSDVIGENVEPGLELNLPVDIENLFEGADVTVALILPEGASIENLLPGFTQSGSSYTWAGDNGISAIRDIVTGQPLADVSYKYAPPSSSTWLIIAVLIAIIVPIAIAGIILWRRR